jgi:hypothetical protein
MYICIMYICKYVCVYMCMCVYVYVCTCVDVYMYMHIFMHIWKTEMANFRLFAAN